MQEKRDRQKLQIVLVSAPWSLFHRPSIQLATLRSYVREKGGYPVDNCHFYLQIAQKIGIECYSRIARSGWAGEAIFAPLLFPEKKDEAARLFRSELRGDGNGPVPDFDGLLGDIRECCANWVSGFDLTKVSLLGFSVCFSQLLPSLYLAAQFKEKAAVPTVFGGASCSGAVGRSLINHFTQIDYLIDGEGEEPLLELCRILSHQSKILPGQITTRKWHEAGAPLPNIKRLDELPLPDFRPYLEEARRLFTDLPFMPTLPVEFSRGCSWQRCTFCNLNLQWRGYRHKRAERMIAEVRQLSAANESLNFAFTDNVLPDRETDRFFQAMAEVNGDFAFFGEIRAKTSPASLARFHRGGLRTVQVGIEAFSSALLARMGKGTTVMDNLAIMKYCTSTGISLTGNLIAEFPGTSPAEIEETLLTLDYAWPYPPLEAASFFLGHESPIYRRPREYGIYAILPHPKNRLLFPRHYQDVSLVSGYRGDRKIQEKQWRRVREKIRRWQDFHRHRSERDKPPLYYRDGGGFLSIHQELPDKTTLLHRLRGRSCQIYLFCEQPKALDEIATAFPRLSREAIEGFVRQLCNKRLMFREADRVLALAIRFN